MLDTITELLCCDCHQPCPVKFALLTDNCQVVYVTTCVICNDHATIKCCKTLDRLTFKEALRRGLPSITYKKVA